MSEPTPLPEGTYTLSNLHQEMQHALRKQFGGEVWVVGEITSKKNQNGNVYIDLVERREGTRQVAAQLKVVALRSAAEQIRRACERARISITEGTEVRVRGRLVTYAPSGTLQLQMEGIDPTWTLGRLVANKDELRRQLTAEGAMVANKRHDIAEVPLKVALVTSAGSAASADFLDELRRSGYAWQVLLVDTRVQGEHGPKSVAAAIAKIHSRVAGNWTPDLIALVRGGGSRSDLATFDTEEVVRAIAASQYPVITGIGHEIDSSLADEAAAAHFKTPTACAQALATRVRRYVERVEGCHQLIGHASTRELERASERLEGLTKAVLRTGENRLDRAANALENAIGRLERCSLTQLGRAEEELGRRAERLDQTRTSLERETERLQNAERLLGGYDPARLLERGWAIVRHDGNLITDPDQAPEGTRLTIQVQAGTIHATAEKEQADD